MVSCERFSNSKIAAGKFITIDQQIYCAKCNCLCCLAEVLYDYCEGNLNKIMQVSVTKSMTIGKCV